MAEVVGAVSDLLLQNYIFPEIAEKIAELLDRNARGGAYSRLPSPHALAERLTEDLQSISHDRHLRVFFDPERIAARRAQLNETPDPQDEQDQLKRRQSKNFGFKTVDVLDGNIGYIDLRQFDYAEVAGDTFIAAMHFLENTDALIFDLRQNGGGSPSMVQLMISHLLAPEPILLSEIFKRPENLTKQYWNLSHVHGKRRPDTDVYILTSGSTFSAAEDFSYTLKHLGRATVIGETTGGGAHPGGREIATDRFMVWLPTARTINPITKTNWEGVGVQPHVQTPAKDALVTAHMMALEQHIAKHPTASDEKKWYLQGLAAQANPVSVNEALLQKYAGQYGPRRLILEEGTLYYQRGSSTKRLLTPIDSSLFMVDGYDDFRLKIIMENGNAIALQGLSDDGSISQNMRQPD